MELRRRSLDGAVSAALADTPVVVVNGARQVGKTTLVKNISYRGTVDFVTLDDAGTREAARSDPRAFVRRPVDTLVIDEAQLEPGLFRAIKAEVDLDRRPGRFVLTGSSRLLAAADMADALVGRVETLDLWPFTQGELHDVEEHFVEAVFARPLELIRSQPLDRADLVRRVVAGGYPEALERTPARRRRWFDSYVTTMAQTTLREIAGIERFAELPRLLRLCAARTGTELNVSSIASDFGVPGRTTDGYITLLENGFLIRRLPAWSTNVSAKVIRRPKLVVTDSGLAAHLLGAADSIDRAGGPIGQLLETFVVGELWRALGWADVRPSMSHFRDRSGVEVDIVLEHPDGRVVGIEVKATSSPTRSDLKGLEFLMERLGSRFVFGVLLSASPEAIPFGPKLAALPVSALWSPWT